MGRLFMALLGMLVVGGPMVLFIWHELSEALIGRIHPERLAMATLLLLVLIALLGRFGRYLLRLDETVNRGRNA
jgi:hypothetical protein